MVNYQLGKVYKIVGNGLIYVGSTTKKYLCQRLVGHRCFYRGYIDKKSTKYCSSYECLSDENYYIELLELCPCSSKDELHSRERKWIELLDCVNKVIPTRTYEEYYKDNRDKIKEQQKEYRQLNKDKIKEYYQANKNELSKKMKEYRQLNKDKKKEQDKQYYQANKDKINEQKKQYYQSKKTQISVE